MSRICIFLIILVSLLMPGGCMNITIEKRDRDYGRIEYAGDGVFHDRGIERAVHRFLVELGEIDLTKAEVYTFKFMGLPPEDMFTLGLVLQSEDGGFICPCHDSLFDAEGRPETGPATKPLRFLHLWMDQEEGQLLVDRAKEVEPTVRLVV